MAHLCTNKGKATKKRVFQGCGSRSMLADSLAAATMIGRHLNAEIHR